VGFDFPVGYDEHGGVSFGSLFGVEGEKGAMRRGEEVFRRVYPVFRRRLNTAENPTWSI
jgi:hypothetical protein